jgi:hypothetical protein
MYNQAILFPELKALSGRTRIKPASINGSWMANVQT